jgi:hypothetical protein
MALQFNQNVNPINVTDAIFKWKQFMVIHGWTITQSSDGTNFSAGDNISSSGSGANGLANNRSWFVIQQPSSARSLCLQRGTGDIYWRIKYSVGGFNFGTPSATHVPDGDTNDDNIVFGTGTDSSPRFSAFSSGVTTIQMAVDNASPYGFYFLTYPSNAPYLGNVIMLDPLINIPSQDQDPYIVYIDNTIYSLKNRGINGSYSSRTRGYFKYGTNNQVFTRIPASNYYGANKIVVPASLPVNPINGNDDMFPIFYILSATAMLPGTQYKGMSSFLKWCGTTRACGTLAQLVSPGDRVIFGDVNLPWNNSVVVI